MKEKIQRYGNVAGLGRSYAQNNEKNFTRCQMHQASSLNEVLAVADLLSFQQPTCSLHIRGSEAIVTYHADLRLQLNLQALVVPSQHRDLLVA